MNNTKVCVCIYTYINTNAELEPYYGNTLSCSLTEALTQIHFLLLGTKQGSSVHQDSVHCPS